jgi:putative toxin-antitoxin system antitoxin component (TIGR02293 family)
MFDYLRHCATRLRKAKSFFELYSYIKKSPLQKKNFTALAKKLKLTEEQSARMMEMSLRTFRKKTPTSNLGVMASEMVIRLSELYEIGVDTFGDSKTFITWLNSEITAFRNCKPALLIESSMGVSLVIDELIRIQHGILV